MQRKKLFFLCTECWNTHSFGNVGHRESESVDSHFHVVKTKDGEDTSHITHLSQEFEV